jgi:hypothetical protein
MLLLLKYIANLPLLILAFSKSIPGFVSSQWLGVGLCILFGPV